MGYYSTMDRCHFISRKSAEEVQKIIDDKVEAANNNEPDCEEDQDRLDLYEICSRGILKDGLNILSVECEDWLNKHYADQALANIIQSVIEPGYYSLLLFQGEDGNNWGYFITSDFIKETQLELVVLDEGARLDLIKISEKYKLESSEGWGD